MGVNDAINQLEQLKHIMCVGCFHFHNVAPGKQMKKCKSI